ncbi:MAG: ATP-binding cassette domain-containing protein [Clostridiales bacterium]|nr:ATP-binding cassette domain-containing protein [Clostridiales bacterium]
MSLIHTKDLTKTFRIFEKEPGLTGSVKSLFNRKFIDKTAVANFDLCVEQGEFIGLIGPNGSGKTTLVKMLTGIIAPSSGEISVLGFYPNKLETLFKKQYAVVMGQKSQLFFELTPMDTFRLFKELYGIPEKTYKRNVDDFVELFGVSELLNVQVRTLSLGERMKLELIAALLHNPGLLFLDEPTIGLDAATQRNMRGFLREVNSRKSTTIILTSHYMEDVRTLCPRCVVINGGKKIYDGGTDSLFDMYQSRKKITITFGRETDFIPPEGAETLERSPYRAVFILPKDQAGKIAAQITRDYDIADISIEEEEIGKTVEKIYAAKGLNNETEAGA